MAAFAPQLILLALLSFLLLISNASPVPALLTDIIDTPETDSAVSLTSALTNPLSILPGAAAANGYVETWTASPEGLPYGSGPVVFQDTTIRQTIPLSLGGNQVTLTISNAYGQSDLVIDSTKIAIPLPEKGRLLGSGSINVATLRGLTFGGLPVATIPMGSKIVSDPVTFNPPLTSGQILSISMYLSAGQAGTVVTGHEYSRTSSSSTRGDQTSVKSIPRSGGRTGVSWYFINSLEASYTDTSTKGFVVVGNSLTDGRTSPLNQDLKWPSLLSRRIHSISGLQRISILNEGSGGNNVLGPARGSVYQAGAVDRFDRDALSLSGIKYVMVFEGINDLGNSAPTQAGQDDIYNRLIAAYQDMISRTHTAGLPIIGGTLTPFFCPPGHAGTANRYQLYSIRETTRQRINDWIRNSGSYDYVVDFDAILRDPNNPAVQAPSYIGRDCLHPTANGFQAMAMQFPLEAFSVTYTGGTSPVTIGGL